MGRILLAFVKLGGLTTGVLLLAAFVLGFALYGSGYFHTLVRFAIEKYMGKYTRTECRVDRVEGNIFTGLDIYGFAVGNGPSLARDGAALLIDEIHVSYNPMRFIRKEAVIDRVYLVRPRLVLNRDPDLRINLARIFGPKGPPKGKGVYFEVENVEMDDAYFKMFLKSPLSEFSNAHIECNFTKARGAVFIDLRDCSCYLPEFGQRIPHFGSGSLAINSRRMHFFHVDCGSATTEIKTDGTIKFEPETYLDLRFQADPLDIGEVGQGVFDDPPEFFGRGAYSGTLIGPPEGLMQSGTLNITSGYLYSYRLEDVITYYDMDVDDKLVQIRGFEGRVNRTPTSVEMTVDFAGERPAYWGEARLLGVNLADYIENEFLTTNVDCRLRFTGSGLSGRDYTLAADARFGAGRLGPITIDGGVADFKYSRGRAEIAALELKAGGGEVFLKGTGDRETMALELSADRVPINRLGLKGNAGRADGLISFDGKIYGPHKRPSFEGGIIFNDFSYGSLKADSALLEGFWKDYGGADDALVHAIVWDAKWGPLVVSRAYGDLSIHRDLYAVSGATLEAAGGATASFDLGYDAARERLELARLDLKLRQGEAHLSEPLVFAREGPVFELRGGVLRYARGELSLAGTYNPNTGGLAAVAEARRIPLDDLIPPDPKFNVSGTLNRLRLDVSGTTKSPVLYANLGASNLNINGQAIDFIHGEASYENRRVIIPGITAGLAGGTLRATAYLPLSAFGGGGTEAEALDATVWFSKFKLSAFNTLYERRIADDGYVEGVITATGTAASPTIRGNLLLSDVRRGELYFAKGHADLTYRDRVVDVREVSLTQATLPNLVIQGQLPVNWPAPGPEHAAAAMRLPAREMSLGATLMDLDLRVINLFTDEVLITGGKARGTLRLGGTYDRPQLVGKIAVAGGEGVARSLRSTFSKLSGEMEATGAKVTVAADKPLAFSLDEGEGRLWGEVDFEGLKPLALDLNASVKDYVVRAINGVEAKGDIQLHLTGTPERPRAQAEMALTSGLIYMEFGGASGPSRPGNENFDYDIHVTAPGNLWLRNNMADIEFEADMTLRRTAGVDYYLGELKARRGYYYFLKRDFEVERADITLTGTQDLDPVLNLRGRRLIRALKPDYSDAAVYIDVTGTLREPEIVLSYEVVARAGAAASLPPSLSQDDILMLLALDVTWDDYQEMSATDLASKESADYVRRYAEAEVARAVRRQTGLEVFQFESNVLAGSTEEPYAEVTVGQHLTREVFVSYTGKYREDPLTGTGATEHAAEVDYELKRDLYLVGSTYEDNGMQRYGLGVRFLHKY